MCVLGSILGLPKYPRILWTWVFNYPYVHVCVLESILGLFKYPRILWTWVFNYPYVHVCVLESILGLSKYPRILWTWVLGYLGTWVLGYLGTCEYPGTVLASITGYSRHGFQLSICTCVLGSIPGLSKYPRILRTWVFKYPYVHVCVLGSILGLSKYPRILWTWAFN